MRESSIESKFRDEVKEVGGMAYKFVSPGQCWSTRQGCNPSRRKIWIRRIETSGRKNNTASESSDP